MDQKTDAWQNQVINAFEGVDANSGADIQASDYNAGKGHTTAEANAAGCVVTSAGKAVKVDGSAFLYVNEQFSMRQQNQASGLASASNLDKQINAKLSQKL
ncbi:MAG: hypothetical protein MUC35_05965 [Candidatus Margulisbacteria bacterium]|jgi:hypothetical protein|nr:hypothetical protein [Candidatus Margulisiibacteriota bacterium]